MTKKSPTLESMGVTSLQEIERYSLQTTNNTDVLRIVYKRKKGSLLPSSKKYRFGRSEHTHVTDSGTSATENVSDISPYLSKAITELDVIVSRKFSTKERLEVILDEIDRFEEDTKTRVQYLKSLIKELK